MRQEVGEWMGDGVFVGDDGRAAIFFHGTDVAEPFNVFARSEDHSLGFHFGSMEAANDRLDQIYRMAPADENEGLVIPVYCRASNPLRLADQYTWEQVPVVCALVAAGIVSDDEADFIIDTASAEMIFAVIEEAGFDCIVYRNQCEAVSAGHDSLLVWRAELLKSPYSLRFDRNDPSLLSQNETNPDDIAQWEWLADSIETCKGELRAFRQGRGFRAA
jgi:hypothetical protein